MLVQSILETSIHRGPDIAKNLDLRGQVLARIQYLLNNLPLHPNSIRQIDFVSLRDENLDPNWIYRSLPKEIQGRFLGTIPIHSVPIRDTNLGQLPSHLLRSESGNDIHIMNSWAKHGVLTIQIQMGKFPKIPITVAQFSDDSYGFDLRERGFLCPDEDDDSSNAGRGVIKSMMSEGVLYIHCLATQIEIDRLKQLSRNYYIDKKSREEYNRICRELSNGFYSKT